MTRCLPGTNTRRARGRTTGTPSAEAAVARTTRPAQTRTPTPPSPPNSSPKVSIHTRYSKICIFIFHILIKKLVKHIYGLMRLPLFFPCAYLFKYVAIYCNSILTYSKSPDTYYLLTFNMATFNNSRNLLLYKALELEMDKSMNSLIFHIFINNVCLHKCWCISFTILTVVQL